MTEPTNSTNPYVGPRTFERAQSHLFFGREREARDLLARVIAQRLTLFYAQSGVGKSSLVNTRLIPQLETEAGFAVLPVGRISGALPAGVETVDNIFIFNLMLRLTQDNGDPQRFAHLTLNDFLAHLVSNDGQTFHYVEHMTAPSAKGNQSTEVAPYVLIIDQFEEIIITHLDRWHERSVFFQQLNQAMLDDPNLWVVLVLREDYVASLDPFAGLMAERMRARFYMQRMEVEAALDAIKKPAELGGRPFAPDVAETLVDNLRLIRVLGAGQAQPDQRPERAAAVRGQYIELVQLQVVCYQLWENLKDRPTGPITAGDLPLDYIDQALSQFYTAALEKALHDTAVQAAGVSERFLRNWFSTVLITEAGTRGLVYRDAASGRTANLLNAAIDLLAQQFLLHTEVRGGGLWVELIHDRFIEPIVKANLAWQASYHNPLAKSYQSWQDTGRSVEKLLRGPQLAEAVSYAQTYPNDVTVEEQQFMVESQRQEALELEQVRQTAQRRQIIIVAASLVILVLSALTFWAVVNARRATTSAYEASARALVARAQALQQQANLLPVSMLLAIEAQRANPSAEAEELLRQGLTLLPGFLFNAPATNKVTQVAFSPNGEWLASADEDGTIQIRNAMTGTLLRTLRQGAVARDVTFSPDGKWLAAASDGQGCVWNAATAELHNCVDHSAPVNKVVFSPNSKWLATASFDGKACLWLVATKRQSHCDTYGHKVNDIAFSPDGKWLASAGDDGIVQVWDIIANQKVASANHGDKVLAIAFSHDGKLATAGSDAYTRIWAVDALTKTMRELISLHHNGLVNDVAFGPDDKMLATVSDDKTARLWDVATGWEKLRMYHAGFTNVVTFSSNGKWLATASVDHTARIWDTATGQEIARIVHESEVRTVVFSPDEQRVATGSIDKTAKVWVLTSPEQSRVQQQGHIWTLAYHPKAQEFATTSDEGFAVRLWDTLTGRPIDHLPTNSRVTAEAIAFSADGQWLATGSDDNSVYAWRLADKTVSFFPNTDKVRAVAFSPDGECLASGGVGRTFQVHTISAYCKITRIVHNDTVTSMTYSPSGKWLVTGSRDGLARVQNIATQTIITFSHGPFPVLAVAFSPDEQLLATAGADRTARLWQIATRQEVMHIVNGNEVRAIAFSPDGQWLATGSADGTARVWAVTTGEEMVRLQQTAAVDAVVFSPDGQYLVTSSDKLVQVWRFRQLPLVQTSELILRVCTRLTRNLTLDEWRRYWETALYRRTCPNLAADAAVPATTNQ